MFSGPGEIHHNQNDEFCTTLMHIQLLLKSDHCEAAQAIIQWHLERLDQSNKEVFE